MSSLSPSPMSSMLRVSNNLNDFDNTLKSIVSAVNEKLESIAAVPDAPEAAVYEAMRYSLLAEASAFGPF